MNYAGFWPRVIASALDSMILGIITTLISFPITLVIGILYISSSGDTSATENGSLDAIDMLVRLVVNILIYWLYFAFMESSPKQATFGKQAMKIYVTDLQGNRISFARATGRHFGKALSSLILYIGYIMAAFTDKKQALHDMMAGCLVVKG
jgi:uncharacterized RDD family membrane protein YckC